MTDLSPQQLAEACADAMYSRDQASQQLGMKIISVAPGRAVLTMTVDYYVTPAMEGDLLTASAQERSRGNRTGVYDITITNQNDQVVAYFRGKSYQVRGSVRRLEE